jgi:hypothetical protein
MGAHCNYAPSSAHRWLACPGCVKLSAEAGPGESSVYAIEGTQAHSLGEYCLEHNFDPLKARVDEKKINATQDMRRAVKVYTDYVTEASADKGLELEQRVSTMFDDVKVYGTADAAIIEDWGTLEIVDYKHGSGKVVEVEDNPQLILYALMSAEKYEDRDVSDVKITIVQPRAPHKDGPVRSATYTLEELAEWRERFAEAVKTAEENSDLFVPGPHCHWCRGATQCPTIKRKADELAKIEFEELDTLEADEIKHFLDLEKAVNYFFKELKEHAAAKMDSGELRVDGYRAVQGYGHRKWTDVDAVIKQMKGKKFKASEMYEKKLISPQKAIKLFGEPYREWIEDRSTRNKTTVRIEPIGPGEKSAEEDFDE